MLKAGDSSGQAGAAKIIKPCQNGKTRPNRCEAFASDAVAIDREKTQDAKCQEEEENPNLTTRCALYSQKSSHHH